MAYGIALTTIIVRHYDEAISFYVGKLGFTLVVDKPAETSGSGQAKRWVEVQPPDSTGTTILLAKAEGPEQESLIGRQFAGRVGMFWHVKDFEPVYHRLRTHNVEFLEEPRSETYGKVVVFEDLYGNKWDLMEPANDP